MGAHVVNTTALISGRFLNRHIIGRCCGILAGMLAAAVEGSAAITCKPTMLKAFSLSCGLASLFGGALLAIVAASLVVEDQRLFLACRANGGSVDACLLKINGR